MLQAHNHRFLDEEGFINAVAPSNETFHKIHKSQYSILFKIADLEKSGKVTWDDFVVFQTLLKKPDAEFQWVDHFHKKVKKTPMKIEKKKKKLTFTSCWNRVAFQYFDQDRNGDVTFEEFKRVFSENLRADSLPFTFDSPWVKLFLGKRSGQHVLGYKLVGSLNLDHLFNQT